VWIGGACLAAALAWSAPLPADDEASPIGAVGVLLAGLGAAGEDAVDDVQRNQGNRPDPLAARGSPGASLGCRAAPGKGLLGGLA
jgi:hypothetical protein